MWTNVAIVILALVSGLLMLARLKRVDVPAAACDPCPPAGASGEPITRAPVSIIIPARNEARRLPPLLASLRSQDLQPSELIVVDDQSTDGTAEIARSGGATVIRAEAPGRGWTGKSRACWSGVGQSSGEWLLFLDADTRLDHPDSLRRLLAAFAGMGGRGALSCQPDALVEKPYESLSAVFNVVVLAGMGSFTPWGTRLRSAGLFGPCILCSRSDYLGVGGHEGVRSQVLEDLALGTAFRKAGLPVENRSGRGLISFRMYPEGFRHLWEGWSKNFSQGAGSTSLPVLLLIFLWVSGAFSATALLMRTLADGSPLLVAAALAGWILYALEFVWLARRAGRFPLLPLLLFPIPFLFFAIVFAWSLIQTRILHRVSWRGRKIEV